MGAAIPADKKVAHLFCVRFSVRLQVVGHAGENNFSLPLTQGRTLRRTSLGISTVHVNRVLQQLRTD